MQAKERRASPRKPIRLSADLRLTKDYSLPCQIADFCAEGLFIRFSGDSGRQVRQAVTERNQHDFVVSFQSTESGQRYELHVRKARLTDGAMGVAFSRPNPAALNEMLALCGASEPERNQIAAPSEQIQFVLHQCARTVIQHIELLMETALERMANDLEACAQRAGSDQMANEMMDSSSLLASRRQAIWSRMEEALQSPLKPERKGSPGAELALVNKTEFEDWLTVKVMVTKADTLYQSELLKLRMRLNKLGVSNATGHQNPLGPGPLTDAFHTALQQIKLTRDGVKLCLRTFDQCVLQSLAPLYEALNGILVRQGVLPDLNLTRDLSDRKLPSATKERAVSEQQEPAHQREVASPPEPSRATISRPEPSQTAPGVAGTATPPPEAFRQSSMMAQTAFTTVKSLLANLVSNRASGGAGNDSPFAADARALSEGELQRELQSLQQAQATAEEPEEHLRERVIERVKGAGDAALTDNDQEALDVVDRFFHSIADSPRLSDHARAQMRKLEVPVLKVVLRDREFFDDTASPVRGVINRLAQLGVKGGRGNTVLQKKIDALIQRINQEFEQDTGVFASVEGELDKLIERQNRVYRRNVERVTAAAEGAQKVNEAKQVVDGELAARFAGRRVPKAVVTLLDGGWRDLLSLTWIRQGADSALWQDYLSVLDSLMTYADDPSAQINLPELLRTIQDGLASISSNHMPSSHVRDELKRFLTKRNEAVEWVDSPIAEATQGVSQESASEQRGTRGKRSLQRWISRAQKLQTGDWMRNQEKPDEPLYMRLVWVAREFSRFVFVNHQGMRVVELTLEALAEKLKRGIVIPDNQYERPLMDESIDRMVRSVYEQLSWTSTHDELTGLLARREFERTLERYLTRPDEDESSLVRLDLRQFRLLNDTAGYRAGDDALSRVADCLREQLGSEVPLARLDSNEFAFLVPAASARKQVGQVISAIEVLDLTFAGQRHRLSACAGIAPVLPALVTAERWLKAAGDACSTAKQQGNARVVGYELDAKTQAQQEQIAEQIAGLSNPDKGQMLLRCQKIIPLRSEASMPTQYEVLISTYDNTGKLISAAEFVRMAERYNRMQAVDRWVVGYMLDLLREGGNNSAVLGGVCINLSGFSLNDESLLQFIHEKLSEKDAPIDRLWFEITEASAINNLQEVAEFMGELKALGCRFCLGNFGSGPMSYQYMRSLPVDMIKLDGAFIRHVATSGQDRAMVSSMVDMAHYTQREVIASQVEDSETLEVLRTLGIDYAQGYAIERPQLLDTVLGKG